MSPLTQEYLKTILRYEPDTGVFRWLVSRPPRGRIGQVAGCPRSDNRIVIRIGRLYMAHDLAWFYVHGHWPVDQIDHINLTPDDNRLENLREATSAQNGANRRKHRDNTSGFKGVSWSAERKKWVASIGVNNKNIGLGRYSRLEDAAAAYASAAAKYHGDFARVS